MDAARFERGADGRRVDERRHNDARERSRLGEVHPEKRLGRLHDVPEESAARLIGIDEAYEREIGVLQTHEHDFRDFVRSVDDDAAPAVARDDGGELPETIANAL